MPIILFAFLGLVLQIIWVQSHKDKFVNPTVMNVFRRAFKARIIHVRCAHCNGDGVIEDQARDPDPEMCPICFGLGMHDIRFAEKDDVICPDCLGMGRNFLFEIPRTCPNCDGRGVVQNEGPRHVPDKPVELVVAECGRCGGDGVVRDVESRKMYMCPVCFGLGQHTSRLMVEREGLCPACGGMGRLQEEEDEPARTCRRCLGRGIIVINDPAEGSGGEAAE
jgi:DnaJ-class molecular chaperone